MQGDRYRDDTKCCPPALTVRRRLEPARSVADLSPFYCLNARSGHRSGCHRCHLDGHGARKSRTPLLPRPKRNSSRLLISIRIFCRHASIWPGCTSIRVWPRKPVINWSAGCSRTLVCRCFCLCWARCAASSANSRSASRPCAASATASPRAEATRIEARCASRKSEMMGAREHTGHTDPAQNFHSAAGSSSARSRLCLGPRRRIPCCRVDSARTYTRTRLFQLKSATRLTLADLLLRPVPAAEIQRGTAGLHLLPVLRRA